MSEKEDSAMLHSKHVVGDQRERRGILTLLQSLTFHPVPPGNSSGATISMSLLGNHQMLPKEKRGETTAQ